MVHEFTDQNFKQEVQNDQGLVMVDFWAPWCGPCRVQGPIVETIADQFSKNDKIKVGKVNVDENPNISQEFQITSIPTLKIFKAGSVVDEVIGLQSKDSLTQRLARHGVA